MALMLGRPCANHAAHNLRKPDPSCLDCQMGDVPTTSSAGNSATSATPNSECPLFSEWEAEYKPLLGKSLRWEGFCWLMKELLALDKPVILETGTLREPGNWNGDGQSTMLWQWVMERKSGIAVSVDGDERACMLARRACPKVHIVCDDSVRFLRGFFPFKVSLLYLDSSDDPVNQLAELTAAWGMLPPGCLIASDDAPTKALWTRKFLGEPEFDGYIACWRKP